MKKKINRMFMFIAVLAISLTVFFVTILFYRLFCRQVMEDLHDCARMLGRYEDIGELQTFCRAPEGSGMRVTLVSREGQVLFDSEADLKTMENHSLRPEIAEAFATGTGQAVRRSETLAKSTFYYALRLENGDVLRIARDGGSIYSIFWSSVPGICAALALLFILCILLGHFLTRKLIQPIEELAGNLDSEEEVVCYEELMPFFHTINEQHRDIIKNARIRQEFTANVTHELKTPLTAISGYAELIETGMASGEDVVRFARGIHGSANRLLALINDILKLSELDSQEQEIALEWLDLYGLVENTAEMLEVSAGKHEVSISVNGMKGCRVLGNRQLLEELLYNLCDNAIRYNNVGGSVKMSVFPEEQKTVLEVRDTGIGISREHQERIFERFYRVDKSRSKSTGGTGLGLAIVKHIVAKHHAAMELESQPGKGTCIRIIFPETHISAGT